MPIIPLKQQIAKAIKKDPAISYRKLAAEIGINPATFSRTLNEGYMPSRESAEAYQEKILEGCRKAGIALLEPPERNFEGARTRDNLEAQALFAWYLCREIDISQAQIASRCGCHQPTIRNYLLGSVPTIFSYEYERFTEELPVIIAERVKGIDAETLFSRVSREEYQKIRKINLEEEKTIMLSYDALEHYGWKRNPYENQGLQSIDEVFLCEQHREVVEDLFEAIQRMQICIVTGITGSGKSTIKKLVKNVLGKIPMAEQDELVRFSDARTYGKPNEPAYLVLEPPQDIAKDIDAGNLLNYLLNELGVGKNLKNDKTEKAIMLRDNLKDQEKKVVMVLDEGNRINPDTLRVLKNFNELSDDFRRLIAVVVFGQPVGLRDKLDFDYTLQEVKIRSIRLEVKGFENGASEEYLADRLKMIGKKLDDLFTADAVKEIIDMAERLNGERVTPLMLNRVTTAALERKFRKYPNHKQIGASMI